MLAKSASEDGLVMSHPVAQGPQVVEVVVQVLAGAVEVRNTFRNEGHHRRIS